MQVEATIVDAARQSHIFTQPAVDGPVLAIRKVVVPHDEGTTFAVTNAEFLALRHGRDGDRSLAVRQFVCALPRVAIDVLEVGEVHGASRPPDSPVHRVRRRPAAGTLYGAWSRRRLADDFNY